jgi:hypothetical protein
LGRSPKQAHGRQPMLFPLPFGGRGQGLGDKTVNSNIFEF